MEVKVICDDEALLAIHKILDYISESSPKNAGKIVGALEHTFEKIKKSPLIYLQDIYKEKT